MGARFALPGWAGSPKFKATTETRGGQGTLFINGEKVGEGRIPVTQPRLFSADETADVGIGLGTPVVEAIGAEGKSRFNGHITKVTVEVRDADTKADAAARQAQLEVAERTQ
jgi:arylsulfatase